MSKVAAFHSKRPGETVYHNNDRCTTGNNIESYNLTQGDGNLKLCADCADLNAAGK